MSDPKRLLNTDSDADALERSLLASLQDAAPSAADKAAIWQGVSAGIVAAGIVGASVGVAASGGALASGAAGATGASAPLTVGSALAAGAGSVASKALIVKLGLVVLLGGASVGGVALYRQRASQATPAATVAAAERAHKAPDPATHAPAAQPAAEPERAADSHVPESDQVAAVEPCRSADCRAPARQPTKLHKGRRVPDQLARESALLTEARAALRSGDSAACQAALARLARTFPHGVLVQEREVLAIELALLRGQDAEARARVASFIAKYPDSPHSERLERLLR